MYGGDEVNAVVLDLQSNTTRAGYAGEDTPKTVIPSSYGYIPASGEDAARWYFGNSGPSVYRGGEQQVLNPLRDSIVQDWDAAERLVEHTFKNEMRLDTLSDHPLLATEPAWNSKANRERMIELAFEGWEVPAFYSVDRAVLSGFSVGRGTALVVDVGEQTTSVIPVHDGFVLRKGIQKSPLTGSLLSSLARASLAKASNDPSRPWTFTPSYRVKQKKPVDVNQAPQATIYSPSDRPATESFEAYNKTQTLHELKESICGVLESKWDEHMAASRGGQVFEFPDGFKAPLGHAQRYSIGEAFFSPRDILSQEILKQPAPQTSGTIPTPSYAQAPSIVDMIEAAIRSCDVDVQALLSSNIVVVGGTTLLPGFTDRLSAELNRRMPAAKPKIFAAGSTVERRFSSWLGGSILASLGTFHQLWISKSEYMEQGKSIIHRRAR